VNTPAPKGIDRSTRDSTTGNEPVAAAIGPEPVADLRSRRLTLPVQGVTADALRSSFHERRDGSREHEAIDILAARGTPVLAVESGRIAKLFISRAGGNTIYQFDPSEQFAYYYAHLERYADGLSEGDRVTRGQTIGYVGTSGNAPPNTPHLHFAIFKLFPERQWWRGTALDPYDVWQTGVAEP
jgi:murein DD-endopeptidase MepM/ murein hydrolase activator NlpD